MNKLAQLWRIASHPRELRLALSGLGARLAGDDAMGGLSADETAAVCRWASSGGVDAFVEIGTLFGFTARAVKAAAPGVRVVAVDNFCWNPFGLNPGEHEAFARRVLEGSGVELVRADAEDFLAGLSGRLDPARAMVFLDGSHAYEDVRRELALLKSSGAAVLSGHDYGNARFGVTRAVDEALGGVDEQCGMCWLKRAAR